MKASIGQGLPLLPARHGPSFVGPGIRRVAWRGWRRWVGRWRRVTRWEFWPAPFIYLPLFPFLAGQALRHRMLTPAAANPAISHGGGLVGESKSAILHGLASVPEFVADWTLIAPGDAKTRRGAVDRFRSRHPPGFPLVLKPDVGQRGQGVTIARDEATLDRTLAHQSGPLIAQVYIPGVEYGIFYARHPDAPTGYILALTDKRFPFVTGNGHQTVEDLILADERAVCLASTYLRALSHRRREIPPDGSRVALTELGSHCRGAQFLDGQDLVTADLLRTINHVSVSFPGFYFGRFDVRAASPVAFQRGEFKVIELNGLSSEPTSIYDPKHSLAHAWRMLRHTWRVAYGIAAGNRSRGLAGMPLWGGTRDAVRKSFRAQ